MGILKKKTAIITGAGRGIGRATAKLFADEDANLILVSRTLSELEETKAQIENDSPKIVIYPTDISKYAQVDDLFSMIDEEFGTVDILVNCAAKFEASPINDYDIGQFEDLMRVNLYGTLYMSQMAIKRMDKEKGGTIVNISSLSGCFDAEKFPGFGGYNISKYALWGLTEIMALENRVNKIRVNQISPSGVDTAMFRKAVPPGLKADLAPEDVAIKILYFASNESEPKSGENLIMSGN